MLKDIKNSLLALCIMSFHVLPHRTGYKMRNCLDHPPKTSMMPSASQSVRPPFARTIMLACFVVLALSAMYLAYQGSQAYERALEQGKADAKRLARSFASHTELTFLAVDLLLDRAVERYYFNDLFGGNIPKDVQQHFHLWVRETDQLDGLYLVDMQGVVRVAESAPRYADLFPLGALVRDRPFFDAHKLATNRDNNIIAWVESRDANGLLQPKLVMSRAFYRIDGEFGGIIFALIDASYFTEFFASIETGEHSKAIVMHQSGGWWLQSAYDAVLSEPMQAVMRQQAAEQVYRSVHVIPADGQQHVLAYRSLEQYPIVVGAVLDADDIFSGWIRERWRDAGLLLMFALLGGVLAWVALLMARQIQRSRKSEAAAVTASQAKSEFLANMSHELRTPLNAIIGFSEMIDAGYFGGLTPKQKERIHDIHLCGNHLLQLINDILEFSKGEAGQMELREEWFELGEVVDECMRMTRSRANMKQVTLHSHLPASLPQLYADKRKIRQLLLNLLTNAVKFTPEDGSVTISVSWSRQFGLALEVQDTGIGMKEEDIPIALSVFGQVHRSSQPEGTGLGLPLCKMFAELHGGALSLTSSPNVGTTVTIRLPVERLSHESGHGTNDSTQPPLPLADEPNPPAERKLAAAE